MIYFTNVSVITSRNNSASLDILQSRIGNEESLLRTRRGYANAKNIGGIAARTGKVER